MKRHGIKAITPVLLALLIIACVLLPAAAQDEPMITIARLAGQVEVLHPDITNGEWQPASTDLVIGAGWKLRTLEGSKVQLVFPQDNVVILKENSVLYVDKLDLGGGASVETDGGSLLVDIRNALSPGSEFELKTPTALAVVRGTKYGAIVTPPGEANELTLFYGYDGTVEIGNDLGVVFMPADTMVLAVANRPPGDPQPSAADAAAFLAELEDTGPFEASEAAAAGFTSSLTEIHQDLAMISDKLSDYEEEWRRMEHNGQDVQLTYLYAQVLGLREQVDADNARFLDISEDIANADPAVAGTFGLGGLVETIAQLIEELYERMDELANDAEPLIGDNQELLDSLQGLIEPGDPRLGLRWKLIDTDNDGISDVDETALGLDPFANSAGDFIQLVAPDDGEQLDFPAVSSADFEFEPLDTDIDVTYNLVLEAEGRQLLRRNVRDVERVNLSEVVGETGTFDDLTGADGLLTLEWYVVAEVPADALFQRIAQLDPGFHAGLGGSLTSERRELTIQVPPEQETVVIDLTASGPSQVNVDDRVVIRGSISEIEALKQWEISVAYDPSVLEFESGRRLGLFGASVVFFGDEPGGFVAISGQVPNNAAGLVGEGDIFELTFLAIAEGDSTVEVQDALLTDTVGNEIPADSGESVDVTVVPAVSSIGNRNSKRP